uniref:Uncharacterized protein n=1 Tax=Anguilla anguilla TaxID=7936 RepID=A0A0E9PTX8_ANGAN
MPICLMPKMSKNSEILNVIFPFRQMGNHVYSTHMVNKMNKNVFECIVPFFHSLIDYLALMVN